MYYTDKQIVEKAKQADRYINIPQDYWIACIRMNEQDRKPDHFNDVLNVMKGEELIMSTTCTTVPGLPALKGGFKKYNKLGAAVVKAGIWMNKAFAFGKHNRTMDALRQVRDIYVHRDGDGDNVAEELGIPIKGMWHTNIHSSTYNILDRILRIFIRGWSYGCIVCNYRPEYNKMIKLCKEQDFVSVIVLDEFSI